MPNPESARHVPSPERPVILSDRKVTTRRKYERLRINEVDSLLRPMIKDMDEAITMSEPLMAPEAWMEIIILVEQRLEPRHAPEPQPLPIHRTEAGYPRCSTCGGGGCRDCTDPS